MPTKFKEFVARELAHAREILALLDSGQWTAGPELRRHYEAVVNELERVSKNNNWS